MNPTPLVEHRDPVDATLDSPSGTEFIPTVVSGKRICLPGLAEAKPRADWHDAKSAYFFLIFLLFSFYSLRFFIHNEDYGK